jgi:DNA invertase Pin-like site-specific DNA recombinase
MNVVLYLRMSSDRQETSIDQQREALKRHAKRNGYKVVGEYRDEGISGDATRKRKGFQKMIADAQDGRFDRILCYDQDRFGRFDMIEAGYWITPLREADVSLETIVQGVIDWNDFTGRLSYSVNQEGKHQWLTSMSIAALRGQIDRALKGDGLCGGSAPYGYRRESVPDGKNRKLVSLVIVPSEANVVKRIFDTYVKSDGSLLTVGEMLNREKIPSPSRKAPWHRNAVRRILRNQNYIGDYYWGRTISGKYHVRAGDEAVKRRGRQVRASSDPIVHKGMIPPLVSRELFDRAQELLNSRRKATRRPGSARPLSGLIFCAHCRSPMHVNFGDYRCSRSVDFGDGKRCPCGIARGDVVLSAIVQGIHQHLHAPGRMKAVKARVAKLVAAQQQQSKGLDTKAIAKQIESLSRQLDEGIERIPMLPKSLVPELADKLDSIRAQRDGLRQQLEQHDARRRPGKLPIERKAAKCLAVAAGLRDAVRSISPAQINQALRDMGVRILFDQMKAEVQIVIPGEALPEPIGRRKKALRATEMAVPGSCNGPPAGCFNSLETVLLEFTIKIPPHKRRPWGSSTEPRRVRSKKSAIR